ncbi:RHS repeat-associated core domain protein [Streptomyces albus]|uniref:RHS repeat-associated core domain protein n=1 Tax=Streptomyces albus (strain ATCC 21838 / DSM 41398 / FERM P-419 / JCM 4703 / NBRC 107858) TaxID=1081613 RepID=A0A0B5EU31_STRA4|nr:RHS repeat-associated core domain protein [Streptomyces albus]AOU77062.1 RHS repeat-associated core domain protein [Streptomyces albus]AYN32840.1 sugar-binding protein [Streptomyces albus]
MRPLFPPARGHRSLRTAALAMSAALLATLLQATSLPQATAEDGNGLAALPKSEKPVAGSRSAKVEPRTLAKGPRVPAEKPKRAWPKAVTARAELPGGAKADGGELVGVPGTPLRVGRPQAKKQAAPSAPARVEARVLSAKQSHRAGVGGPLFSISAQQDGTGARPKPTGGPNLPAHTGKLKAEAGDKGEAEAKTPLTVAIDYAPFAQSFGGSYANRLRLVQLPACAVTDPGAAKCRTARPLAAAHDPARHTLTAKSVTVSGAAPAVLAVTAAAEGDKGTYKATDLAPSAAWQTNLNTGDFSWSYDMPVPDVPGGLKPTVGLSYSSASIDGRTGGTNNQGSWAGDGFDLAPGFIERRYKPCADDGVKNADGDKPGDLCWDYDNAFLTFNGKGGELVPTGSDDEFKLQQDDGTRIKRLKSADRGNGDNDGEYWRLTNPAGIRYYFGYNRLPGWSEGKETTGSTWTAPVYGDDSGEDCHQAAFADSWCQQAWRWQLDYVVDPHGNAVGYHYTKETNSYGRNLKAEDDTPYTRGGYLDRIDYGLRSDRIFADKPLAQVVLGNAERCLPESGVTCAADTIDAKASYWYDTPWDLNCKADTTCDKGRLAPSFWTRKRLTDVTTQVLKADGTYGPTDTWKLSHRWGMADTDYQLLLDSVQHTGQSATPAVTLPKTTFAYTQLANRLDKTGDGYAPFIKARLSTVADESGGQIDTAYSAPACDWGALPTPQTNTTRCFPQYIGGDSESDPELHWFNKYVTTTVTSTDRTGGALDQVTQYQYLDGAAWHFDDSDGLTKEKNKTWSQWRGYGHVRVLTGGQGGSAAMRTQEDSYFLRGMDGDRKDKSGGTKEVSVALGAGEGDPLTDHASAAGFGYRTAEYDKPGGKILTKTVNRPWHHQTAKKVRDWGTVTADLTGTGHTKTWASLDDGAGAEWRTTSTSRTYDTVAGRITEADDFGDGTTATDNQCVRTSYATNSEDNILGLPARVETVATSCGSAADRSEDVLSDVRTAYDGKGYGAAPTKGDATASATLKSHTGTKATYLESGSTFDDYGRVRTTTDLTADVTAEGDGAPVRTPRADGRTVTTAYTPATGLPTQTKVTTPPAKAGDAATAQTTTTAFDPLRGQPLTETDTNGAVTDFQYDALGRNRKVWLTDRRPSQVPNYEFVYTLTEGKPAAVATKTLNHSGGQITSYALYDGFLRPRQTQAPGPNGGALLTDTFYDERGLAAKTFATYYTNSKPGTELFEPADALAVETQTRTAYDGLNRPVQVQDIAGNGDGGKILGTTRTVYGGDRTTVIPPAGGTATTTLADARGRTTELRQHHSRSADAPFDTTAYAYTPRGELAEVTDPAGNSWSYGYDQLGRQTRAVDPDKGTTTSRYDDRGQLTGSSDARPSSPDLAYVYDGLGRKTELHEDSASGPLRAKWVYDTVNGAKGQLTESTRYVDGEAYTSKVTVFDSRYRPMKTSLVIPAKEGALAGTYQYGTSYWPSGLIKGDTSSGAGALPGGGATYMYDAETLRLTSVFGRGFGNNPTYSLTGKPLQLTMKASESGLKTQVTNTYEFGTQRLANSRVDRENQPGVDRSASYRYDEAGNILSVADVSRDGTDNQCFQYDGLRRLTKAWAQGTAECKDAPAASALGGPAPYWHDYAYNKSGQRLTETIHDPAGTTTKDRQRAYAYPAPGSAQPHTLSSVTETTGGETRKDSYTYDEAGNTLTRPRGGAEQTLGWDAEGHLAKVSEPDGQGGKRTTEYLYDTEGNRLIGRTPTETTLYLGHTEVVLRKGATTAEATRYTDLGDGNQAVTKNDGTVSFTLADHHGTGQLAVDAKTLKLTQRRVLPFGDLRGTAPTAWPGTRGFVGGTDDTAGTGLTHLGAREYDTALGQFLSVDPLMETDKPQTLNGFSYGAQNPLFFTDPSGLGLACGGSTGLGCGSGVVTRGDGSKSKNGRPTGGGVINPVRNPAPATSPAPSFAVGYARDGQPTIAGVRVPSERELGVIFPENSYTQNLMNWGDQACRDDSSSALCDAVETLGWTQPKGDWLELIGYRDAVRCKNGSVSGCVWTALGVVPIGKLSTVARAGKATERTAEASRLTSCLHSFVEGTEVRLADGTSKAIEKVKKGDRVLATDPDTGKTRPQEVVATIVTQHDKNFVQLRTNTDGTTKKDSLTATTTHPFWSPSEGGWIDAGDLRPGMTLRSTDSDRIVTVTATRHFTKRQTTYDLTVSTVHTYYVLAGATPVLVHNSGGCPPETLIHYTDEAGMNGIVGSKKLNASTKEVSPKDARYGDGQYLSDIAPGTKTCGQLSRCFLGHPFSGRRFTNYVEIDVRGLNVVQGRDNVFVIPNQGSLDLNGRIIGYGAN